MYARQRDKTYADSPEWAADVQSLQTHFSSLKLRLNPREVIAQNFLDAARKLDQAARIHRWADVELANEIMVRHGQWILKYEWNRVKLEAASGAEKRKLKRAQAELDSDYVIFLENNGSFGRLKLIGAGEKEITVTLARSEMDVQARKADRVLGTHLATRFMSKTFYSFEPSPAGDEILNIAKATSALSYSMKMEPSDNTRFGSR